MANQGDLQRDLPSMVSEAKRAGYRTGVCGKAHVPHKILRHFDYMQTMTDYRAMLKAEGLQECDTTPPFHQQFMSATATLPKHKHRISWTADRALDFLRETGDAPFLLWCSFDPPHAAHTPAAEFDDLYNPEDIPLDREGYQRFERSRLGQRAMMEDFWKIGAVRQQPEIFQKAVCRYLALITQIDEQIGRVLDELEKNGQADDTIVVFTADHGDFAGHWGQLGKNVPGYDDLLRIPFIYYDPDRQDHGRCIEGLYQNVDLFPSLWERLGLDLPPTVQGKSFLPALDGYPDSTRDYIFSETHNVKIVRNQEWKLIFHAVHPEKGQLFRMGAEPDETANLWDEPGFAHIKQRLLEQLTAWMVRCEQADGMDDKMEPFVQTRWYEWLAQQPHQSEDQDHPINRG
jgi:arylsulfatase A-like enzyme